MIKTVALTVGCSLLWVSSLFLVPKAVEGSPEGRQLVQSRCTVCHNLTRVRDHIPKNDRNTWHAYVTRMQKHGARVSDAEKEVIVDFLSSLKSGKDL
ncbi:MAG: hypothetical protein WHS46_03520 [Desulfosoma sp.]